VGGDQGCLVSGRGYNHGVLPGTGCLRVMEGGGAGVLEWARHSKLENDDFMSLCLSVCHYRSLSDEQYVLSSLTQDLHKMLMLTLVPLGSRCLANMFSLREIHI
jgi:hypothetical protein